MDSTNSSGAMVYSMNYCSVVHDTICQVSLSTGGPAPSVSVSTEGAESASAAESTTTAYESIPYPLPSAGESSSASSAQVTAGNSPPGGAVSSSASESASNTGSGQDHETTGPEPTAVPTGTSAAMGVAGVANAAVFGAVAVGALFALM